MIKPCLSIVLLALCWLVPTARLQANEFTNPGFGKCAHGARHAAVPATKGLSYDKARMQFVTAGWLARVTMAEDLEYHGTGQANLFWQRGYREVGSCAVDRNVPCVFNFIDKFGNRLEVYTGGAESEDHRHFATVSATQLYCPTVKK
jgi:hypothetical protein